MSQISVFGLGYVGLTFATCLASKGFEVIGVDVDPTKVETINKGKPPFHEPGLDQLLATTTKKGQLTAITDPQTAVLQTQITFICVGTPSLPDGSANLEYLKNATKAIAQTLAKKNIWHLIVIRSTVPPGTTQNIVKPLIQKNSNKKPGKDFGLCVNPEFLREGTAIHDILHPSKIVIGEIDKKSGDTLEALYRKFYKNQTPPIIRTTPTNAELIKYANNAFLATKISFINTIANICQRLPQTNIDIIAKAIGLDPRINSQFLQAGPGFGGSCFPKDLKALIATAKQLGYQPKLLQAVLQVNEEQPQKVVQLAEQLLGNLKGKRIAILGLAYKPSTDDIRESPAIKIINRLLKQGAQITVHDPAAIPNTKKQLGNKIQYANTPHQCLKNAHLSIIITDWPQYKQLTPQDYIKHMKTPNIIDTRRIYNLQQYKAKTNYIAIGIGPQKQNT